MRGLFSDTFFHRQFTASGVAYCERVMRSIGRREFATIERDERHSSEETAGMFLQGTWKCSLKCYDGFELTETLVLRSGDDLGNYFGYTEEEIKAGAAANNLTPTSMAVINRDGAISMFNTTPQWLPSRFWVALCWTTDHGKTVDGFCGYTKDETPSWGRFRAVRTTPTKDS